MRATNHTIHGSIFIRYVRHCGSYMQRVLCTAALIALCSASQSNATPSYGWNLQTDYAYAPAKLSEGSINGTLVSQMNAVDSAYSFSQVTPNGSGLNNSKMQEIDDLITVTFQISRDGGGALTGRSLTVIDGENTASVANLGQPASFNGDWIPGVNKIIDYYASASPSQEAILEQAYLDMIELFLNYNPFPGWTGADLDAGNGYTWRNTAWKTLRMSNTLPSTERNLFGLSMFFCSGGQRLLKESHAVGMDSSTDDYHTTYQTAFNALTLLDENAFKWQLFNTVRLQLDKSIVGYPESGQNGLITIDGGVIHHTGHHTHYAAYSYLNMIKPHRIMTEAGFVSSLTEESIDRFRKAAVSWSWTDTNGEFPVHYNLRPTHPSESISGGKALGNTVSFLQGAAELTAAYLSGNSTLIGNDLEMAYPAVVKAGEGSASLPSAWQSVNLPTSSSDPLENWTNLMQGHHTFQVVGAAIHRQDDWLASVRGAHTYRRGGEGYENMGGITHHHEMNMRGSLLLITEGKNGRSPNSADSGYFYEGWDHNFYPNVTTPVKDLIDHLYWRKPAYFNGAATFTGGANLFDNGTWFYVPTDGSSRKSAFFFGNRITLVTSDINYASDSRGIITGLIQQGAPNFTSYPITLDGTVRSGTGQWSLAAGGNHKITDINGNGYYIHPGAPAIEAVRGVQGWTYGLASYWKGSGSMPAYTYDTDFVADVDAGNFDPTEGNYSTVYFDHGTSANNESLAYTVLVQPSAGELDALANNLNTPGSEPFTLDTANNRHLLYDVATDTYAATLFTSGQTINQGGLISASRAGAYMWRTAGSTMYISCGSSDMGDTSAFQLVVQGEWSVIEAHDTLSPVVNVAGGNTTITLPYRQFARQEIVLSSLATNDPPIWNANPVIEVNAEENTAYSASLSDDASDPNGDPLSFSSVAGPSWLNVAPNGALSGTPGAVDVGANSWTVQVTDGQGGNDSAQLNITVDAAPLSGAAHIDAPLDGAQVSATFTVNVSTTGSAFQYVSLQTNGVWMAQDNTAPYSFTVTLPSGAHTLTAYGRLIDGVTWSDSHQISVTVVDPNNAPLFTSDPVVEATGMEGAAYSSTIADNATDADSDPLTFSKLSGPAWLSVASNGSLSGTPAAGDAGLNSFSVQVSDGTDTDTATLEITVDPLVTGPVLNYANSDSTLSGSVSGSYLNTHASDDVYQAITETESGGKPSKRHSLMAHTWVINVAGGNSVMFYVEAYKTANSEGDDFVFAYSTDNVNFSDMLTVSKTADDNMAQSYVLPGTLSGTVYIRVRDTDQSNGNKGLDTVFVDELYIRSDGEAPPNQAPVFAANPVVEVNALEGTSYSASLADDAADPEGDTLSFSKLSGPAWLTVGADGSLSGTPSAGDVGLNSFVVQVDATGGSDTATLEIIVDAQGAITDLYVASIAMSSTRYGGNRYAATATVSIQDEFGAAVSGANVSVNWSGATSETMSGSTDSGGTVTFESSRVKGGGTYTITVSNVSATGYNYNAGLNGMTSDSTTAP